MSSGTDRLSRAGSAISKTKEVAGPDHGESLPVVLGSADPVIVLGSGDPVIVLDSADAAPVASAPEMHVSSPLARLIALGAPKPRPALLEQFSKAVKRTIDLV